MGGAGGGVGGSGGVAGGMGMGIGFELMNLHSMIDDMIPNASILLLR